MTSNSPAGVAGIGRQDALTLVLAGTLLAISLATAIASSLGLLPDTIAVLVPIAAGGALAAVALRWRARMVARGGSRIVQLVSLVLFGVSIATAVATYVIQAAGNATLTSWAITDLRQHAWFLLLIALVATPARTIGLRPILGSLLFGFFGATMLAKVLSDPVLSALGGPSNVFATSVWVPIVEEACKVAPVVVVAVLARRNRLARPGVVDLLLLGAASGAGFALMENLQYGRLTGAWSAVPPLSWLDPGIDLFSPTGPYRFVAGHAMWTACAALGVGVAVLYSQRIRIAWATLPIGYLVAVIEHGVGNDRDDAAWLGVIVLAGAASSLLVVTGLIAFTVIERRAVPRAADVVPNLLLRADTVWAHRRELARRQCPRPQSPQHQSPRITIHEEKHS